MKWKKLSTVSCAMISMFAFLFFYGILPMLSLDKGASDTKNLREMSQLIQKLERENSALLSRIASLQSTGKDIVMPSSEDHNSEESSEQQFEQRNPISEQSSVVQNKNVHTPQYSGI